MSQTIYLLVNGKSVERDVGTHNAVCDECEGEGKVNTFAGSILTLSDFGGDEDDMQDFIAANRRGSYDVTCDCCKGKRVVKAPNIWELTPEELAQYRAMQDRIEDDDAMHRSEARYGA